MHPDPRELFRYFYDLLRPVGILVLFLLAIQIFGAIIGAFRAPIGFVPLDAWYGGAYASPIGFLVGLLSQSIIAPSGIKARWFVVVLLGLASIFLPVFGYFMLDVVHAEFAPQ